MKEFLLDMQTGIEAWNTGGQYLVLFLGSLLFLFLVKPKENKEFRNCALWMAVLLLFPLTAFLIDKYRTDYYNYASVWSLLPVTVVIALGLTEALDTLLHTDAGRGRYGKYVVCAGLVLLLALCGTVSPFFTDWKQSDGFEKIRAEEKEVLEILSGMQEERDVCIWAPDEVVETARAYDGNLKLLYGRDMWNNALSGYTYDVYDETRKKLYDWMNTNWIEVQAYELETELNTAEAFALAKDCGCTHLVLKKEQLQVPQIEAFFEKKDQNSKMVVKIAETQEYEIYEFVQ